MDLVRESDFIFIICPLTDETRKMFNAEVFNNMKSTSVLVNIARGDIVDQEALYDALKSNKIFAAGLDVMSPEPLPGRVIYNLLIYKRYNFFHFSKPSTFNSPKLLHYSSLGISYFHNSS